jgi:hypothetical protein
MSSLKQINNITVKLKLSLFFIQLEAMKTYVGVEL